MMLLVPFLFLVSLTVTPAHLEDEQGCEQTLFPLSGQTFPILASQWSEDGRYWVVKVDAGHFGIVERRFQVLPRSQWKDPKDDTNPSMLISPTSYWIDKDRDGFYEEFFLDTRLSRDCHDMAHFRWDGKEQRYYLVAGGRDHA